MKQLLTALLIFSVLLGSAMAQSDDSDNKEKKSTKNKKDKITIKIDKNDIPARVNPGESFSVNFSIKNNSKKEDWNFSGFTVEVEQPFSGSMGTTEARTTIPAGEEMTFSLAITAPTNSGKEKLEIHFFNDGKKKKQLVKTIRIGDTESNNGKTDDDDGNKKDDKDKNKKNGSKDDKKSNKENSKKNKD